MARTVEDELQCPFCLDIFKDPVMLPCSHSFCRVCVQQWWEDRGDRSCPVCRKRCRLMVPASNLALRNVCETLSQASVESEDMCSLHKEKLKLFCLDHQELVCLVCRDAELHAGHNFRPLDEVVKCHKEKLQEGLQDAKKRLKDYNEIRDNCNQQAKYLTAQRNQVESKIKKDFKELRHFLQVEEEARLSAAREEEQKKSQTVKDKMEALDRDMAALSDAIRSAEEQLLKSSPVSFMKNCQDAVTRIQELPDRPEPLPAGTQLDQVKHVGNLKFAVWEKMKQMVSYSPVILDPNTAHPKLNLSEDLTSVSFGKRQQRPKNRERSMSCHDVRGSALASGTNMWDVEVGDNTHWKVGVVWGDPCLPDKMNVCNIAFRDQKYIKFGDTLGSWNPPVKLQRIRVHVDTNEGSIFFSESLTNTQLCKMNPFFRPLFLDNKKMFPYFRTRDKIPLQIIPLTPRVTTQNK